VKKKEILQILFVPILIFFIFSFVLAQRQTGTIFGTITDEEGNPLPGATVIISSPSLMGMQSFMTTTEGSFRFPACPPGKYVVRVELSAFQTVERPGVIVNVGSSVRIDLTMKPATIEEAIIVTAPMPVVDTTSAKVTSLFTSELIENIPIGRDIYELVKTQPSLVAEGPDYRKMVSIHGSTLEQSTYSLDGVDLTDPHRGYISKGISFDAIEEVEMILSGHGAEVGRTAAGYINVVTKSGGNNFSGGITAMYAMEDMFSSTISDAQLDSLGLPSPIFDMFNYDLSLTLGGPIIKDRLWFFLNPQIIQLKRSTNFIPFTDAHGEYHGPFDREHQDYGGFAKLTAQITPKLKYMAMWQYLDMREDPASIFGGPKAAKEISNWWLDYSHTLSNVLTFVIDQNTFVEARAGYVFRKMLLEDYYERGEAPLVPWQRDVYYGTLWGLHSPGSEDYRRKKLDVDLNLTRYVDDFLGVNHEFKAGVDYTWWYCKSAWYSQYPYEEYYYKGLPWEYHRITPYLGDFWVANVNPTAEENWNLDKLQRYGFYVQDVLSIGKRLTLNIGLRYDSTHFTKPEEIRKGWYDDDNNGLVNVLLPEVFATYDQTAPEIKDMVVWNLWQPRIGLTFDPFGDGKTALKASFSRYAEKWIAKFGQPIHPFNWQRISAGFLWWDDNQNGIRDLPPVDSYQPWRIPQVITDPDKLTEWVDPDLSSPYTDEFTSGIQRELFKDFSAGLTFIYRENKNNMDQIDKANPMDGDMWVPYTVTDPGADGIFNTGDEQNLTVFALKKEAENPLIYRTNVEELKRKYWAVELVMQKRMSNNWQLSGSVTYSKMYGNLGAGYHDTHGDQNLYTNPNSMINRWGRLNWDRPLMVKLMGTLILPYNINLSAYYRYMSGSANAHLTRWRPITRTLTVFFPSSVDGFAPKYTSVTVNAEPSGSKRQSSISYLDIRLEKEFTLGFGRLGIYVDVINLLGFNRIISQLNNGGYLYPDGTFERYPTYGNILEAEGVRSFRFTLRFHF